jgi:hypothetical protein
MWNWLKPVEPGSCSAWPLRSACSRCTRAAPQTAHILMLLFQSYMYRRLRPSSMPNLTPEKHFMCCTRMCMAQVAIATWMRQSRQAADEAGRMHGWGCCRSDFSGMFPGGKFGARVQQQPSVESGVITRRVMGRERAIGVAGCWCMTRMTLYRCMQDCMLACWRARKIFSRQGWSPSSVCLSLLGTGTYS